MKCQNKETPDYQETNQLAASIPEMERQIEELTAAVHFTKCRIEELKLQEMYEAELEVKSDEELSDESQRMKEMYFTLRHAHTYGNMENAYSDYAKWFFEQMREKNCNAVIELTIHPCDTEINVPRQMFYVGDFLGFENVIDGKHKLVYENLDGVLWWCAYDESKDTDESYYVDIFNEREVDDLLYKGVKDYLDTQKNKRNIDG